METPTINILKVEMDASKSHLTEEEYSFMLWVQLAQKEAKKHLKRLARDLNVYPRLPEVHAAVMNHLTNHIQA